MKNETKKILTNENWYPVFSDGTVKVFLSTLNTDDSFKFRVSVWGDDDFGLEKDFDSATEARNVFNKIVDYTTQQQLYELGFCHA